MGDIGHAACTHRAGDLGDAGKVNDARIRACAAYDDARLMLLSQAGQFVIVDLFGVRTHAVGLDPIHDA